jgi:predicted methyltransferase
MKAAPTVALIAFAVLAWPMQRSLADSGAGEASQAAIKAAIESPDRPKADLEQDARRKPQQVLEFAAIAPGMHVIDVLSASGYYSELLARVVGAKGQVIAYNNPPYAKFAEKGIVARYAGDRLPNVKQITSTIEDLKLIPSSLDAALFIMSYHDLYWRPADGSWPATDPMQLLARLYAALKPGGAVVVEDHVANPGGDADKVVDALHRIDPELVKRDFAKAGFTLDGSSNVLAHPEDDHLKLVFDEAIRGKTDQFLFRFRKPAK